MADSKEGAGTIRTTCPRCGRTLEASSLDQLIKLADKCCKAKTKKLKAAPRVALPLTVKLPFTMTIELPVKSGNQFQWSHWTRYAGYKKAWFAAVAQAGVAIQGIISKKSLWRIVRHYTGKQKEFDHANLVNGCKPIPDALKHIGAIYDDAPRYFTCEYAQLQDGKSCTDIILVESNDTPPEDIC